ncbi:hypothetical protein [uncultured Hymenobacter sp.]|uniref:hypothetical protein n=1 Tax=uncultured Hymenobacter sp. TaxID=170016 RepID=UPI0035C95B92
MARSLKLDIITLSVSRRGKKDEYLYFDDFFRYTQKNGSVITRPFADFFKHYIASFNGAFSATANVSKAIHLDSSAVRFNARRRFISGTVDGGNLGGSLDVKDKANAANVIFRIGTDHVTAEPFHFLLWMPADFEKGILLVQGYTNATIADAFKQHLAAFVRQECPDVLLHTGSYVDRENAERFRAGSVVDQVTFRRTHIEPDVADHITGIRTTKKVINVDVKISGLNKLEGFADKFNRWVSGEVSNLFEIEDLRGFGIDGEHETIVGYKTEEGQRASAKSKQEFELNPLIRIEPEDVSSGADGRPNPDEIRAFMQRELARIQEEIGYTNANRAE